MSKILVIEDDRSVRTGIVDLLTEAGYEVSNAENGAQGISQAKAYLPDLIISDILMPGIDGYMVFSELQKDIVTCGIPFIFLSAKTDTNDVRYAMNLGVDDYLTKPYKATDLISAVRSRLSKRNYIDKKFELMHTNIATSLPHELRTPLVAIVGLSQLILDYHDRGESKEMLEMVAKINEAGTNLNKITDKFLLFTELEVMKNDKEFPRDFSQLKSLSAKEEIYSYVLLTLAENKRENDIEIHLEESNLTVLPEHLKLIIEEAINNACQFSKPGSKIFVNSHLENDKYIIEIEDHGFGMTAEQINQVGVLQQFDRHKYFQGGLGMGLVLIRDILSLYGGELIITSEKNKSTAVKVILNIAK